MTEEVRIVVVGVGNPWRRDDGAGPAVAASVREHAPLGVRVIDLDGETARILDAWAGADLAVVVDAVHTGAEPGTVHRIDADAMQALGPASSHGLGLQHAFALGRAVGRLPRRLVVVGVEGADFGHGTGLTGAVAAAVGPATRLVADVIEGRA